MPGASLGALHVLPPSPVPAKPAPASSPASLRLSRTGTKPVPSSKIVGSPPNSSRPAPGAAWRSPRPAARSRSGAPAPRAGAAAAGAWPRARRSARRSAPAPRPVAAAAALPAAGSGPGAAWPCSAALVDLDGAAGAPVHLVRARAGGRRLVRAVQEALVDQVAAEHGVVGVPGAQDLVDLALGVAAARLEQAGQVVEDRQPLAAGGRDRHVAVAAQEAADHVGPDLA